MEQKTLSLYAKELELKERRAQEIPLLKTAKNATSWHWKEMENLNTEFQKENQLKLDKMKEHKRKQILELHQAWKIANNKKYTALQQYSTQIRKQAIISNKNKGEILDNFRTMIKGNTLSERQRDKMASTLQQLNTQLDLGLKLAFPPLKSTERPGSSSQLDGSLKE